MGGVAIITDSAADLTDEQAAAAGITVVPLLVRFGTQEFRSGVDLSLDEFYRRLTAPGAPFPSTAACSPGDFQQVFARTLDGGADAIVCVTVGSRLSGTYGAAQVARDLLPGRDVQIVDSGTASMAQGLLATLGAEAAAAGEPAVAVADLIRARRADIGLYVVLDTLEYLRRGGRISAAQAAIGSVLSVKPIITIENGIVVTADRPRTNGKARARLLELLAAAPVERIAVIHAGAHGIDDFAVELADRTGVERRRVSIGRIGPTVAPHVGPGAYGAATLLRAG